MKLKNKRRGSGERKRGSENKNNSKNAILTRTTVKKNRNTDNDVKNVTKENEYLRSKYTRASNKNDFI